MYKERTMAHKFANFFALVALLVASVSPALLANTRVNAAQITERSITLSKATASAPGVTYSVSFKNATAGTVQGIIVDFCTTALVGTSCTGPTGLNITSSGTLTIDGGTYNITTSTNLVKLINATGTVTDAGEAYSFDITVDNPSTVGTFYARILTYSSSSSASGYSSESPGSYVDNGSVALSTTNDITVTGLVTETLTFCVGATDSTPNASDADIQTCGAAGFSTGKTVSLGVIDSSGSTTPVNTINGGTNTNGAFLVKTNAVNGVTISYKANQDTSSGKLKVAGSSCVDNSATTDPCINSAGTVATTISGEKFGMAISQMIYPDSKTNSGTTGLVRNAEYDWTSSNTYAWDDSGDFDEIASSTSSTPKVLDYELGVLKFSAVASPTTPSGSYTVSANFVATPSF